MLVPQTLAYDDLFCNLGIFDGKTERSVRDSIIGGRIVRRQYYEEDIGVRRALYNNQAVDITWALIQKYLEASSEATSQSGTVQLFPLLYRLLSRLIHHLALIYLPAPRYQWVRRDGSVPSQSEIQAQDAAWSEVLQQIDFHSAIRSLDEITWLCNTAFCQAAWRGDRLYLDVLWPDEVHAFDGLYHPADISSSPYIAVSVLGEAQDPLAVVPTAYWRWDRTTGTVALIDSTGRKTDPLFGGQPIPYRDASNRVVIPVAVWHHEPSLCRSMYPDPDEGMVVAACHINLALSDAAFAMRVGAHGQLVAFSDSGAAIRKTAYPHSPTHLWTFGAEDRVERIEGATNAKGLVEWISEFLRLLAVQYDVPGEVFSGAESALSKMVDRWDLHLSSIRHREDRVRQAAQLYDIICPVWNFHSRSQRKLDPSLQLVVEPGRLPYPADELHKAQADQAYLAMGVLSPLDIIMQRRGVSRDEARRILAENKAELAELKPKFSGAVLESATNNLDAET
jgi:hypothetical protein